MYHTADLEISVYVYVHIKTLSSYLPVKFVNFLKSGLILNKFYCF